MNNKMAVWHCSNSDCWAFAEDIAGDLEVAETVPHGQKSTIVDWLLAEEKEVILPGLLGVITSHNI